VTWLFPLPRANSWKREDAKLEGLENKTYSSASQLPEVDDQRISAWDYGKEKAAF